MKSKVMLEMNLNWARENPALFSDTYQKFFDDHEGWEITAIPTKYTLTLVAIIRKETCTAHEFDGTDDGAGYSRCKKCGAWV